MSNSSSRTLEALNFLLKFSAQDEYLSVNSLVDEIARNSGIVTPRTIRRDINSLKAIYDGCIESASGVGGGIRLAVGKIDLWVINRLRKLYPQHRSVLGAIYADVEAKYLERMRP